MKPNGFKKAFLRELQRMYGKKSYTVFILVLPVLAFLFFATLLYQGMPTDLPVAVLDLDNTSLSRQAVRMVDASSLTHVKYKITSEQEGKALLMKGDIEAFILLPEGLEKRVFRGEASNVVGYINETNVLKGSLVDKDLRTVFQTFSTGIEIQMLMKKGLSQAQAYSQSMPVFFQEHTLFNPYLNYSYFLLPCFLPMMLLIFVLITTIFVIGSELKYGTAKAWLEASGGSIRTALVAKMLPYTVIFLLQSFLMNVMMYRFLGVPFAGSVWVMVLANLGLVFAYQSIGVLIISVLGNLRLSMSIGGGYSVLAFSYSGLTFPFMAMGSVVAGFGQLFPFTFYLETVIDQALRGAPAVTSLFNIGVLGLFTVVPLLLLPRLKTRCLHSKYWGKQ